MAPLARSTSVQLFVLFLAALAADRGFAEEPPGGTVETVAGTGLGELNRFSGPALEVNIGQPFGLELGPDGTLFICEVQNHRLLRLDLEAGRLSTVAGTGKAGSTGDGGPAAEASLNEPYEVRVGRAGDLYLVEMRGAVVRRIDHATGRISKIAGTGEPGFGGDGGPALEARLKEPHALALDAGDRIYVADLGNQRIRRIDPSTGRIETIAGNGALGPFEPGAAAGRPLPGPRALAIRGTTLWIALREGHRLVSLDLATGRLAAFAGTGRVGWKDGGAEEAAFNGPKGLALDAAGRAYLADTENHAVRRVEPGTGVTSTLAGGGPGASGEPGDGGPPGAARFDRPHGIAVTRAGDVIYVGDSSHHRVRRIKFASR